MLSSINSLLRFNDRKRAQISSEYPWLPTSGFRGTPTGDPPKHASAFITKITGGVRRVS